MAHEHGRTGEGWRPPSSAGAWPDTDPLNRRPVPASVSVNPQGSIPVIVRLVWSTGEEMLPARAIRWTGDNVMVLVPPPGMPAGARELLCWLAAGDVYRTIPRRRDAGRT